MTKGLVTVFGADGFLGRHVVRELAKNGWRVRAAVRTPHAAQDLRVIGGVGQIQLVQANLRYPASIERALDGVDAVINVTGILFKQGRQNFDAVHRQGVKTIADLALKQNISNIAHVSAMGAHSDATSSYARSKAEGEAILAQTIPSADIFRPSILFGENDGFFTRFARMAQLAPALPLIGGGKTRFQPVYVNDVARAIVKKISQGTSGEIYELGGPKRYTFKQLLTFTMTATGKKPVLIPLPWLAGQMLGLAGEIAGALPFVTPFLTRDQVEILRSDNITSGTLPGLAELGIEGETLEAIIPPTLEQFKKYGQFHQTKPA